MRKIFITCAVSGAETMRSNNPAVPYTPQEIADSAYEAYKAGASILHLHVRNDDGTPTQDIEVFRRAIELVRSKCNMVIEVSTGGAVGMSDEERLQPVMLRPELASLDCGTSNFGDDYVVNTLPIMRRFAQTMKEYGVRPTLECFDLSNIFSSKILIKEGLVEPPYYYGFGMNIPGAIPYTPEILAFMLRHLPEGALWTAVGISRACFQAVLGSVAMGGHTRVGFEDNVYMDKGVLAVSNAQMVEKAANIIKASGNQVATPDDVRAMLNLKN
ncbi:MAG: 3-keto-5-aminohexanoate cleavage protein [bacterium]|nr:3-keto-5-aminohexanoate cleavage protein [bacterium]